jgi:hypothetical protein
MAACTAVNVDTYARRRVTASVTFFITILLQWPTDEVRLQDVNARKCCWLQGARLPSLPVRLSEDVAFRAYSN